MTDRVHRAERGEQGTDPLLGGIVVNLLIGQGFKLHPGGLISSIVFASLILWIVTAVKNRGQGKPRHAADGSHREPKGGSRHHKG